MGDQRRFQRRSGRLVSTPINDGWALTLYERDPQVPNLPLEPQPPTEISGTASLAFGADLWTDGPKVVIPAEPRRIAIRGVYRTAEYRTGSRFAFWQPVEAPAPSGDIAGTTTLTFGTGTVTLTGAGALVASAALTFDDGTSVLRGAGALATVTPLTFGTGTVALTGAGALAGTGALTFGAAGAFELGPVNGSAALAFGVGTASLTGTGALSANGTLTFGVGTASLGATAAVSAASALTLGTAAALTGRGALAGSTALVLGASLAPPTIELITGTAALVFDAGGALIDAAAPAPSDEFLPGGYRAELRRQRRRRRRDDDESKTPGSLPAEAQAGPGSSDATPTAPAADLALVRELVAYWSGEADRALLNRRAQRALDYALRAESVLAMQLFERELARQMEEEETVLLMLLLNDD